MGKPETKIPELNEQEFPHTAEALRRHLKGRKGDPIYQVVYRAKQRIPPFVQFLFSNPDVLEAMAADAKAKQRRREHQNTSEHRNLQPERQAA